MTLLISLFLFASCEKTSTIGLEIDPNTAIQGSLVDTVTISSRTLSDKIVSSNGLARNPLGLLTDPLFGKTEANLSMAVNVPSNAYSFGTTPTLDSAVLVLNYGGEFYGDSTSNFNLEVRQLVDDLSASESFLSNQSWLASNTVIGSKSGKLYPNTRVKVTDIVTGKADTIRSASPQIRIQLNKTFIENNIININAENLKNNQNFVRFFRGLQVKASTAATNGSMMFFEFTGSTSGLYLYYKNQNTTTNKPDTIAVNFPILNSSSPVASTVTHNYSTAVTTQLSNPNQQYPVTYLQPLSGLKTKISFPYLKNFVANVGKVVVNKAELVIDLSSGTDPIPFNAAPRLALYRYDIAEQRKNIPDNDRGSLTTPADPRVTQTAAIFGGYFNAIKKQYVFVVTAYIQDLLNGKTQDYGTFLAPTPTDQFSLNPSMASGARSVIGSFKKNPVAGDNVMKLNIYYTKIN
ncbi:DUF4270 domain-containing protein [Pedobacter sp. KR3-3]|uniref:DUF4270 domain-containing protein n=1 Tax=Pedobacter albus TaxID=3113905 RepID=A0ABU7IAG2_9SPHI|nr:DUF4270 domain-containing protein [Pedobacter sp. KR3-3]MEE1946271.1 DUF4270 domain-containing protein [Pedobacter sp. KR3-3]